MKRFALFMILAGSLIFGAGKVAITVKTAGPVNHIHADGSPTNPLKLGAGLADEDVIQTGKSGFAAAMYLDDKTTIKVREDSEFLVGGVKTEDGINKRVVLNYGKMRASVAKQTGAEFLIATPTSVASVKGTEIVIISDPSLGDLFITLIGSIEVTNNSTGNTTTVAAGETVNSTPDGTLDVTVTEEGDVPDFDGDTGPTGEVHELRFEVEDIDGSIREIIIQYQ